MESSNPISNMPEDHLETGLFDHGGSAGRSICIFRLRMVSWSGTSPGRRALNASKWLYKRALRSDVARVQIQKVPSLLEELRSMFHWI